MRRALAALAARPWLAWLLAGLAGFVFIGYGLGGLAGLYEAYPDALGRPAHGELFVALAWLWLIGCWITAVVVPLRRRWRHRRRRRRRHRSRRQRPTPYVSAPRSKVQTPKSPDIDTATPAAVTEPNIAQLGAREFEQLIAASFRRKGFEVEFTPEHERAGIDLVLRERNKVLLVQCRHGSDASVDVAIVRELVDLVDTRKGQKAILATASRLSPAVHAFCRAHSIHALDIDRLLLFADPAAMPPLEKRRDDPVDTGVDGGDPTAFTG
ncbi:restriction endonuclease [Salinisphaera sp. S4-8]|uniref:restriction endonuclease n=1 Tax=Salinisphaera sp. S4-8 TaxID=633357 RepID=UPI00334196FD